MWNKTVDASYRKAPPFSLMKSSSMWSLFKIFYIICRSSSVFERYGQLACLQNMRQWSSFYVASTFSAEKSLHGIQSTEHVTFKGQSTRSSRCARLHWYMHNMNNDGNIIYCDVASTSNDSVDFQTLKRWKCNALHSQWNVYPRSSNVCWKIWERAVCQSWNRFFSSSVSQTQRLLKGFIAQKRKSQVDTIRPCRYSHEPNGFWTTRYEIAFIDF